MLTLLIVLLILSLFANAWEFELLYAVRIFSGILVLIILLNLIFGNLHIAGFH